MRHSWFTGLTERWSYRSRIAAVAIVAGGLATAGLALATIPDSSGVIHGCYSKSGGAIRIIDDSVTNCKSSETAISWSVKGPAGPTGPTGETGATGATGSPGVSGWEIVEGTPVDVAPGQLRSGDADCPAGKRPVGGGFTVNGPGPWTVFDDLAQVNPQLDFNRWVATIQNDGPDTARLVVQAICVTAL